MLAPLLATLLAQAPAPRTDAAFEWSGVSDALVARCGLSGLTGLVVQDLVAAGYAVVRRATADGVTITLTERGGALELLVRSEAGVQTAAVAVGRDCESSLQLEVLHQLSTLLARDRAARAAAAKPEPPPPPAPAPSPSPGTPPVAPARASSPWPAVRPLLALGVDVPLAQPMLAASGGARVRLHRHVSFDVALEAAVTWPRSVVTLEAGLAARASVHLPLGSALTAVAGLSAALYRHQFFAPGRGGGHFDGRFGVPLELWLNAVPVGLRLVPYLRLTQVEHVVDSGTAFSARAFGVVAALVVRLGGAEETARAADGGS